MTEWRWVRPDVLYAIHEMQLAQHGGLDGIQDQNGIESALDRAEHFFLYGDPPPDAASLAAAYAFGLAHNHGFADGNKRTAWVAARLFLAENNIRWHYTALDAIRAMESVAGGALSEAELAEWFRTRIDT